MGSTAKHGFKFKGKGSFLFFQGVHDVGQFVRGICLI
jgi:hypothetical protein